MESCMKVSQVYPNLRHVTEQYRGILLDAYGVFWGGNDLGLFPKSIENMERLVAAGKIVGILSNTTQLAAKEIHKFHRHGLIEGKHFHFFVSSGEVVRSIFLSKKLPFQTPHKKFWVYCRAHPKFSSHEAIFQDTVYSETLNINEADFIYINIPHIKGEDQINLDVFQQEIQQLKRKDLPMVCPNPDRFAHEGSPSIAVVRQGSIAALYENIGGQVYYIGKPYENVYTHTMMRFNQNGIFNPKEILMVGDTPETDVRGARNYGMASALITQTGIMSDRISEQGMQKAVQDLSLSDQPDYFIGKL